MNLWGTFREWLDDQPMWVILSLVPIYLMVSTLAFALIMACVLKWLLGV